MKTLMRPAVWRILGLFYANRNAPLHLRRIAREAGLNESSASRHLNQLTKAGILGEQKEANLRKFSVRGTALHGIFPLFDDERLDSLPALRKGAITHYLARLRRKPILIVVFGSTAKKTFTEDSDLDILEVFPGRTDTSAARAFSEAQTGIRIQAFQLTEHDFGRELKERKDMVVLSALTTGFPVFNQRYFYEVLLGERVPSQAALTFG